MRLTDKELEARLQTLDFSDLEYPSEEVKKLSEHLRKLSFDTWCHGGNVILVDAGVCEDGEE